MNFLSLIEAKREGHDLSAEQVREIITRFTAGQIPNYQMAAFLMAIYFRGLSKRETELLTLAMRNSGEVLTFPKDPRPLVDKHSTGGVGDKVSLPLAPLLACLGFRVPMISGRGWGLPVARSTSSIRSLDSRRCCHRTGSSTKCKPSVA